MSHTPKTDDAPDYAAVMTLCRELEIANAELLEAARAILASDEFERCPDGRWSTADCENYWRRIKLEAAIAKAEGK